MYQQIIRERLASTGNLGINAGHVEYLMRVTFGTLDGLSRTMFNSEIDGCAAELRSCDAATLSMIDRGARADRLI